MAGTRIQELSKIDLLITQYPLSKIREFDDRNPPYNHLTDNLTIGDLHANALKLINILIQNGIADIKVDPANDRAKQAEIYARLVSAYYSNNLEEFNAILAAHLQFSSSSPCLCFIGDTLSDRGKNDLFIFQLYKLMHDHNIKYKILLSNHDCGFLNAYFKYLERQQASQENVLFKYDPNEVVVIPSESLAAMCRYFSEQGNFDQQNNMIDLFKRYYLPNLKLIGYELDSVTNTFTLSTHAPFGLADIKRLANYLKVELTLDATLTSKILITAIDEINSRLKGLIESGEIYGITHKLADDQVANPIYNIMWNRVKNYDSENFIEAMNGLNFRYQHGHDWPTCKIPEHVSMLDNIRGQARDQDAEFKIGTLGKSELLHKHKINVHHKKISPDYSFAHGINAFFYAKLERQLTKLNELQRPVAQGLMLFEHDVHSGTEISNLCEKIEKNFQFLPKDQLEFYAAKLGAILAGGNKDKGGLQIM